MTQFKQYKSVSECKARKITEDDGETIITANGAVQADKGSYEVHVHREEGRVEVSVVDGETFEREWTAKSSGTSSKSCGKSGSQTQKRTTATKSTASKRTSTAKR